MVDEQLPRATHTGKLRIAGFTLTVYQLDNGQRVYEADSELERLFEWMNAGGEVPSYEEAAREPEWEPVEPEAVAEGKA